VVFSIRRGGQKIVVTEPTVTPAETADYISGITRELRALAAKANLGFLAYLLAMAEDEAGDTARRLKQASAESADGHGTSETAPPG
jgi:hypothetical protein